MGAGSRPNLAQGILECVRSCSRERRRNTRCLAVSLYPATYPVFQGYSRIQPGPGGREVLAFIRIVGTVMPVMYSLDKYGIGDE